MASPQPRQEPRHYQPPATALLIYPATLLLGSLFSILSPTAHHHHDHHPEPFVPSLASDVNLPSTPDPSSSPAVNYFARKNNIFNQYFVKIGWFWTTLAFATVVSQLRRRTNNNNNNNNVFPQAQALLRYTLATLFWYLTTQWFFGPGIIDRAFVFTGGRCERVAAAQQQHRGFHEEGEGIGRVVLEEFSGAACKAAGGHWRGGHDVSGHVFMLVLATAMLAFEGAGLVGFGFRFGVEGEGEGEGKGEGEGSKEKTGSTGDGDGRGVWARRFVWGVAGLGWWMLFMTAIWFHTWLEKWSGLLFALGAVYIIYILPRRSLPWRNVVGVPGV